MARKPRPTILDGQGELFGRGRYQLGRTERSLNAAVAAARKAGALDPTLDSAAVSLARDAARAVDRGTKADDTWKVVAASRELREILARLGLDPKSRAAGASGDLVEFLQDLAAPAADD